MKVLITGGNGYIAKSISKKLSNDFSITAINRNDLDLLKTKDVNQWFSDKHFDVVIHTAIVGGSRLFGDNNDVMEQNVKMHYNLIGNSDRFEKFISFGSGAELFHTETPYGMGKRIIANSLSHMTKGYNLRIFGVFDENELCTRFIKSNITKALSGKPMEVHENKMMDFFYMEDLIRLVTYYILEPNPPQTVNCSYSDKFTLYQLALKINEVSGLQVPIQIKYQPQEEMKFYMGSPCDLPIEFVGLHKGINQTYKILCKTLEFIQHDDTI